MIKKYPYIPIAAFSLLILTLQWFISCASQKTAEPVYSADSITLDAAINEAASYFIARIPSGTKVALIPPDALSDRLSDYIFEELWARFEDSQNFIMIDRRNLERIDAEIRHQYQSGRVDDEFAVSISKQYGAEILVYGQIAPLGSEYRMTIYATDVEKASSSQRAMIVRPDTRLGSLINVSLDDEIDRAVSGMAKALNQRTVIAVGRISYAGTETVSGLSAWLKNSIISRAQKQQDKFQIASEDESSDFAVNSRGFTAEEPLAHNTIQAVITGTYSPLDDGAEVSLQMISTAVNKPILSSSRFVISAPELERRKLSLLPEKDNVIISKAEFEAKQQALDPYAGKSNRWGFTVTPDVLDGIYYSGDYMSMRVFSERDAYFRIIHVDVNGNTQVIYPATEQDNNFIRAGETRGIPDNTRYRMGPPYGEEIILAAAYDRPFTLTGQGAAPLSADNITRSFTVNSNTNTAMNPSVTAKYNYTILPKE